MRALRTFLMLAAVLFTAPAGAQTPVRLNTSAWTGNAARLSFQLTSNNKALTPDYAGSVTIYDFEHNGRTASPSTLGGALTGDLILQLNPSFLSTISATSPDSNYFGHSSLGVNFDSLGTGVVFNVDLAAFSLGEPSLREEFAFYILKRDGSDTLFPTGDPLGANALFALQALDPYGTQLSVFSPAILVPPDSVVLDISTVSAPHAPRRDRLLLGLAGPHPVTGAVRLMLRVPPPGARLMFTVHDINGRRVRVLADRFFSPGEIPMEWDGRDDAGQPTPAGVFWIVGRGEKESISRKVVRLR